MNLPNLIINGVHKSGTTSLFMYLKSHPSIFGSTKKEVHYFTPIRFGNDLLPIEDYAKYFSAKENEEYAVEASPSYFYGKEEVIDAMKSALPEHKIILMLREPSVRFLSFHRHLSSKLLIDDKETLESFLQKSIEQIGKPFEENNPYSRAIQEGFYANFLEPWIEAYGNNLRIVYFEDIKNDAQAVMLDIAKWLNLDIGFYNEMEFTVENKTVYVENKGLHKLALTVNNIFEGILRNNPTIKRKIRDFYYVFNASKRQKAPIDDTVKSRLIEIYRLPNMELRLILEKYDLELPSWL